MKKVIIIAIIATLLLICGAAIFVYNHNYSPNEDIHTDECSVEIVVADNDNTTITYANEIIKATSNKLSIHNNNDFPVEIVLIDQNEDIEEENNDVCVSVGSQETTVIDCLRETAIYSIGCRADVPEGTLIKLDFSCLPK